MLGYTQKVEIKWFILGFAAGAAAGYAQGAGMVDILGLLPI
ncbi:MAG: hypothetical protein SVU88_04515 [Candidatus Nanohaloarchaea archaeon]|nr:hypothetical protein [Candidatus Nanohaloarchaea archaeon]